jgi:lipid II:glycine glycyltransferase (peptidoglycan interpeptide bridge formation enzyme)
MSIFAVDFTNSFSESFLTEVKNTIKSSKKTEVDLDPKLNVKSADVDDNDNDEDDQFLDADDKVGKRPKKNKKSSVSEKYNVSFSDKEIAHFEKIINKEGIKN